MKKRLTMLSAVLMLTLTLTACDMQGFAENFLNNTMPTTNIELESEAVMRQKNLSGYGYEALQTDEERRVYALLDAGLSSLCAPEFVIYDQETLDNMGSILEMYKSDHPEVFWIDDNYGYEYTQYPTYTAVKVLTTVEYDELIQAHRIFEAAVEDFFAEMPSDLSDYRKELYINDRLLALCAYDDDAAKQEKVVGNEQNAYGALVDHKAVCEGYTRAFQLLCTRAGIPCISVNGVCDDSRSGISGNHIWNAVRLDGDWYYVDATWNDFTPEESDYKLTDIEKHLYFNVTTERLERDHAINPAYGADGKADYYNAFVPECTAEKYNYFHRSVPALTDLDDCDEFLSAFTAAAANGDETFSFRVSDNLDYGDTMEEITNGYAVSWIDYSNSVNDDDHQLSEKSLVFSYEEMNVAAFSFIYR